MYERKCQDWVKSFADWTVGRSEAPYSFILWTALFTLSSAIRRNVKISRRYLGSWDCDPHLYVFFVAPAGKAKKSTTMGYAEELLDNIPTLTRAPSAFTIPVLVKKIQDDKSSAVYILSSEFSNLILKSGTGIYDILTDLFDGRRKFDSETISRGIEFVDKPCINFLAATTPGWIAENMSEAVIGGGFASRVIFVFEERSREYRLFYDGIDTKQIERLKTDLISDLTHISEIEGEFTFSDEAKDLLENWYKKNAEVNDPGNKKLSGYYQRRPKHIMTVAMLLHLSYSDELCLNSRDVERAIETVTMIEPALKKAFRAIGDNKYAVTMDNILEYILANQPVLQNDVLKHFYASAEPKILLDLLASLLNTKQVGYYRDGEKTYLKTLK